MRVFTKKCQYWTIFKSSFRAEQNSISSFKIVLWLVSYKDTQLLTETKPIGRVKAKETNIAINLLGEPPAPPLGKRSPDTVAMA